MVYGLYIQSGTLLAICFAEFTSNKSIKNWRKNECLHASNFQMQLGRYDSST